MGDFFRAGIGLDLGGEMFNQMESMMHSFGAQRGFRDQFYDMSMERVHIPEEFSREARFQPGYEDEEYQAIGDHEFSQPGPSEGHDYSKFERKLAEGILDAPKLDLHQVPPSIFDNVPPLTIIYLKDNHIQELPEYFFDEIPTLAWLDVRDNKLTTVPALNSKHEALRVILLQGNRLRTLPYTLALAVNLRTIGLTGNPLTIPPEDVRKKGCKAMLKYLKQRMFMRVPMDETGEFEPIPANPEEDEQLRKDLKKTASKAVSKKLSSLKAQSSVTSFNTTKAEEDRRIEKLKYTWDLWKRIPFDGKSREELFQKSMDEARNQVLAKLNCQREAILQKCRDGEVLRKWRSDTQMMRMQSRPKTNSSPVMDAPFGNDFNKPTQSPSKLLKPDEYQKELTECWDKLKKFASNPTSISDTNLALERLREVEEIQKRLMDIKLTVRSSGPLQ